MTSAAKHKQANGVSADIFRDWADQLAAALEELSGELGDDYLSADILLAEYRGFVRGVETRA